MKIFSFLASLWIQMVTMKILSFLDGKVYRFLWIQKVTTKILSFLASQWIQRVTG
jgi:hypothetical protein